MPLCHSSCNTVRPRNNLQSCKLFRTYVYSYVAIVHIFHIRAPVHVFEILYLLVGIVNSRVPGEHRIPKSAGIKTLGLLDRLMTRYSTGNIIMITLPIPTRQSLLQHLSAVNILRLNQTPSCQHKNHFLSPNFDVQNKSFELVITISLLAMLLSSPIYRLPLGLHC